MGKKKGFNWKARHPGNVKIDNSNSKNISIDIEHKKDAFDDCNTFVLPNEKRKTKKKDRNLITTKLLSKKQRKHYLKVCEQKEKKEKRTALFDGLSKVVAPEEELKQYISLAELQTKGLKRHFREINKPEYQAVPNEEIEDTFSINAIKGNKKQRLSLLEKEQRDLSVQDPNIIDLNDSSESEPDYLEDDKNKKEEEPEKEQETAEKVEDKVLKSVEEAPAKPQKQNLVDKKATFVSLNRKAEVQKARLKLPILAEEQAVVEAINENPVVIITGETGSGKTTQVPQFLYEAGYASEKMIGITEPRRVAAISMSERVAEEMNLTKKEVSFLIRFEGNVTSDTKIKFMTDGVLLKEIQNDFLLTKYSVIILDEAHERSIYTDILIGLLTRIVKLREKRGDSLKLIIMSATLRVQDFVGNDKLFRDKPPVINVESRQFPVTIHFNKKTSHDYIKDALRKAVKVHTQLPDGGILIFLTGQREVNYVVRKLRQIFPFQGNKGAKKATVTEKPEEKHESDEDSENEFYNKPKRRKNKEKLKPQATPLPKINLDVYSVAPNDDTQEDLIESNFQAENSDEEMWDNEEDVICDLSEMKNVEPLWVLPLYSLLPTHKQAMVFKPPPEGSRLCVVSTNVSETSLTIPNVKYVIDSGRSKIRLYDKVTGVSTYTVAYTSKAGANQRAGRAGRTAPGHCYRLYSSAVFNDQFEEFSEPEIRRKPVDDLILQMKVMNIHRVVNFPFPTPPGEEQLKAAERRLCILGALERPVTKNQRNSYSAKVTDLGRNIAAFPVAPRYGKMLALSQQHDLMGYTVCMVSALSIQELLIEARASEDEAKTNDRWVQTRQFWAGTGNNLLLGDPMILIRAVGAAEFAAKKGKLSRFCEEHGLREKAIVEIRKLRQQLSNEIMLNLPGQDLSVDPDMPPPTDTQAKLLRQILLSGNVDQVTRKVPPEEVKEDEDKKAWKRAYQTLEMEEAVFMQSSSVLRKNLPEWVVYQEIYETNKTYMRGVTAIEPSWLPKFAPSLCRLSAPLIDPAPRYDEETGKVMCFMSGKFGRRGWQLPIMELEHPKSIDGVKLFARFFLEGKICPKLQRFKESFLIADPSSIDKSWANNIPRVQAIMKELLSEGVMSRDKLFEIWSSDKNFLLAAYKKWVKEEKHAQVSIIWPPM